MPGQPPGSETEQQHFDRILSQDQFKPLKAILNELRMDSSVMRGAIVTTNSYPNFLGKLGYRVVLVKQIHEQDCYSRLGPAGGIRAVLPHHDMATYSTLVTLVNFDSTLTTTPKSVDFYDRPVGRVQNPVDELRRLAIRPGIASGCGGTSQAEFPRWRRQQYRHGRGCDFSPGAQQVFEP